MLATGDFFERQGKAISSKTCQFILVSDFFLVLATKSLVSAYFDIWDNERQRRKWLSHDIAEDTRGAVG